MDEKNGRMDGQMDELVEEWLAGCVHNVCEGGWAGWQKGRKCKVPALSTEQGFTVPGL